jgi:hypothetical protein
LPDRAVADECRSAVMAGGVGEGTSRIASPSSCPYRWGVTPWRGRDRCP